MIPDVLLWQ